MINSQFLEKIPHRFQNQQLLTLALTHPSTVRNQKNNGFERLEFLGDRVLGLIIAQTIYERYPQESEGDLAKRLAALVCREACQEVARMMGLADHLNASSGGFSPNSAILADAVEALIGALYLDGGLSAAMTFINMYWPTLLEKDVFPPKDAKTQLQEFAQSEGSGIVPVYEVLEHSGPNHAPVFTIRVSVKGLGQAMGTGNSKRQAEQEAAKALLAQGNLGKNQIA